MSEQENKLKPQPQPQLSTWTKLGVLLTVILIILVIGYVTVTRYRLVGKTIDKGDLTSSVILLSPELSAGIANILATL